MSEAVDDVAEKEFRFRFRELNPAAMDAVFSALHDFGGSVELVSSKGIVWTPNDSENLLKRYFSDPGATHTVRAKTGKEIELYKSIFANFPNYVEYD